MITIFNNSTEENVDQVMVSGCPDPLDMTCQISVDYNKEDLLLEQQVVHDEFMNILGANIVIQITNLPRMMSIDRMHLGIPSEMTEITELDYNTMSVGDKAKVDAYIDLTVALSNV
jgi:hypothetical protein